jgi:hypothetical protein
MTEHYTPETLEKARVALLSQAEADGAKWDNTPEEQWDDLLMENAVIDGVVIDIGGAPVTLARTVLDAVARDIAARALEAYADGLWEEHESPVFNPHTCKTCDAIQGLRDSAARLREED